MGNFIKSIDGPIFDTNWTVKSSVKMDADDLKAVESAEVIDSMFGRNLKINLKSGGNYRKKISPRMDLTKLPVGTKVDLMKITLCTLSKPGEKDIQNFEVDGCLAPEFESAE